MRTRAFNLCKEHWKLIFLLAVVGGLTGLLLILVSDTFTKLLAFSPLLGNLVSSAAVGVVTILLYPLEVGITYILLNLWQCAPADASQLLLFYKSPRLCRGAMVMGGIVTVITVGVSMAYTLLNGLFDHGMLRFLVQPILALVFVFLSFFLAMRFMLVPVLYLADPSCSPEEAPKASYHLMRGHCVSAFFFQLVTILVVLPVLFVLAILGTLLILSLAIPTLLAGSDLLTDLVGSTAAVAIAAVIIGFVGPWVSLCITGYAVEEIMGHPAPPPANRFTEE